MTDNTTSTNDPKPGTRKIAVGSIAGAIVTILTYILSQNGITIPAEVFGAASTVATALFVYLTRETFT
ncbi:MAG: hypothetical protein MI743_20995 [Sneathiellales bacterium]|nr:hypothetical protein [Sneathiellales bacterium]